MKKMFNKFSVILLGCFSVFVLLPTWVQAQNLDSLTKTNTQKIETANSPITAADDAKAKAVTTSTIGVKLVAGEQTSKYTLGSEDVISITVLRHPEVSGLYTINSEGKIQYEFIGDAVLSGLTKEEAAALLAKKLETYIVNPDVAIKITEYNSKVVYVVGEVGAPGKIFMRGDTITIRDALLAASLPQLTAATDNATMFTPSETGKSNPKKVNVYALLYKGDLRENYIMKPGDTIYLPATLWAKFARFINPVAQPIGASAGTAKTVGALAL